MSEKADDAAPARQEPCRKPDGTFAKGHSGNPTGGRRGYRSLRSRLLEQLHSLDGDEDAADRFVRETVLAAFEGDKEARKLVWEYMDGKPTTPVELSGPEGAPMEVDLRRLSADDLATLERILGPR